MRHLASLVVLCVVCLAPHASAQSVLPTTDAPSDPPSGAGAPEGEGSDEDLDDLEELLDQSIVTSASRSAERASTAPATVLTLSGEELRAHGIRTVEEALVFLGVGFQAFRPRDYYAGSDFGTQGLMLRDAGRRVLVMLDGHVLNAQDTGHSALHEGLGVPLEAIDHIEVMLGPGSVVYGSNAMTAVVHVFTRDAASRSGLRATAELGVSSPQGIDGQPSASAGDVPGLRYRFGAGFAHAFRLFGSPAEVTLDAEWLEEISNTYRTPLFFASGTEAPPGEPWGGVASHSMQAPSVVGALRVGDFRLAVMANHYRIGRPLVGVFAQPDTREERTAVRIDLRHGALLDPHVQLTTRVYADFTDWSERTRWLNDYWCLPGQIDGCDFTVASRGRSAGAEQQLTVDWNLDGALVTTLGYDLRGRDTTMRPADYRDSVTGDASWTLRAPYRHVVAPLFAVFAQQVWRPWEFLTINLGARLDVDTLSEPHVSPRAAVVVTPVSGTVVRLAYSHAFRAPSAFEIYDQDLTFRGLALRLAPEVAHALEIEWQQRIEWLTFSLRAYGALYEDFIASRALTEEEFEAAYARGDFAPTVEAEFTERWDNLDTLESVGGSLTVTARPVEGLVLGASISFAGTWRPIEGVREELPLVPTWLGNVRAAWTFAPRGATLALAASFSGRRGDFLDYPVPPTSSSEHLDLRVAFTAPVDPVPGFRLRVVAGYSLNSLTPYRLTASWEDPDEVRAYYPSVGTLFGLVGIEQTFDP